MKAAFFRGRHPGLKGLFGQLIKSYSLGRYSHVELQFDDGICASSTVADRGVRYLLLDLDPKDWDFVELPDHLQPAAKLWFDAHIGKAYDFWGDAHFLIGFIAASRDKWFCSRAVADALGIEDGWRYDPNSLASAIKLFNRPADAGFFTPTSSP